MKLLVDTHILLWALNDPKRIDPQKLEMIETGANIVYVSSISVAEIMIKSSLGKLAFEADIAEIVEESGFEVLDFGVNDALLLKELPYHHRDPFDRMLICQSMANRIPIVTDDGKFQMYDCEVF